jgi:hypothetical protein
MNKLFVRLAVAGAVAVGVAAPAAVLADSASIDLTGPFSTNVVTNSNRNSFNSLMFNRAALGNWNNQYARSGNVSAWGNTKVLDFGGSGNAYNSNYGRNNVSIGNSGMAVPFGFNSGGGSNGSIFLTGPRSFNAILGGNNSNRFNETTINDVRANNFSNQSARSGAVNITGNTLVEGVGGSGNATNVNSGVNRVNLDNQSSFPSWGSWSGNNGGSNGSIAVTGPGSFNAISGRNSNSVNLRTINDVNATNSNRQTATTGNVTISGNTVVRGVGGSGDATNWNSGQNDVGINNN